MVNYLSSRPEVCGRQSTSCQLLLLQGESRSARHGMPSMSGLTYGSSTLACRRRFCEGALGDHWQPVVSGMDNGLERAEPAVEPSPGLAHYVASAGDAGHGTSLQLGSFSARWSRCGVQPAGRLAVCCDGSSVNEWNDASTQNAAAPKDAAGSRGEWRLGE